MADITKQNLRDRVLQSVGVLAAGATAATADQTLVEEKIDALYAQLRRFGVVRFAVTSIPDYAQQQMEDVVAFAVAPKYGVTGQRLVEMEKAAKKGNFDLQSQVNGNKQPRRVRVRSF